MRFRRFIWTVVAGVAATKLFAADMAGTFPTIEIHKPNILMILADDLGYMDLGCYGSDFYKTPNIDRLAAQGVRFTNAYTACSVCSPTRAAIVTGKYPARLHITDWIPGHARQNARMLVPDWQQSLPESEATIGGLLKGEGYATAWLGKWHLGGNCREFGFDAGKQNWTLNKQTSEGDPKGVFALTGEAIDFMEGARDKPFFVCVSHYAVHTPIRFNKKVKLKYQELVNPTARQQNAGYAAMVEALDDSVGRLLQALEKSGKDDNTLVIFYSDNGGLLGQTSNAPLRGGKGMLYEGGTRVPLIVRLPKRLNAGTISDAVVTSTDFLPTFMELAGAPGKGAGGDGISLLPHLLREAPLEREAVFWHYPHYHKGMPGGSIRKGDYKLIEFFEDGKLELYRLPEDPHEQRDLSSKMPEKVQELLADLQTWRKAVGAQAMKPNPSFSAR